MGGVAVTVLWSTVVLSSRAAAQEKPWFELYEQAVGEIEEGRPQAAVELLKQCLAARPQPQARLRTQGVRYVDYLPYLYLGIAWAELGKNETAEEYFDLEERHGAVKSSEEGLALLKKYRLRLMNAQVLAPPPAETARPRLSEEEFRRIETQVIDRCRLERSSSPRLYPWYFHYELGLEMLKHEDPSRALDSLLDALEKREKPQRLTRTYGMWYLNYAPYYNIGLAHYKLGNYECAADAFKMSATFEELSPSDAGYAERERLRQDSSKKLEKR